MATKHEQNYVFASARVHALENGLLARDKFERLLDAPDETGIRKMLSEFGYGKGSEALPTEEFLEAELLRAYTDVSDMLPGNPVFRAMRIPYDNQNLKLAIKCERRTEFSYPELATPLSVLPPEQIEKAVSARDFSVFPEKMAEAAPAAIEAYDKTGDPQQIDLILDAACFADMKAAADKSGSEEFVRYLAIRADSVNLLSAARILAMGRGTAFMADAFVPGGTLPLSFFSVLDDGETAFAEAAAKTAYGTAFSSGEMSFSALSGKLDAVMWSLLDRIRMSAFGAGAAIGYLAQKEKEIRNLRVILAAKQAGESPRKTRERLTV